MAKLCLFGALALISAVFVAARNTYQKEDANIDEEIKALVRQFKDPFENTIGMNKSSGPNDENVDDTDGDDEDDEDVDYCMGICKVETPAELCNCTITDCIPDNCPATREVGDVDEDDDDDLDEGDGESPISKKFFRLIRYRRYRRYRRSRPIRIRVPRRPRRCRCYSRYRYGKK